MNTAGFLCSPFGRISADCLSVRELAAVTVESGGDIFVIEMTINPVNGYILHIFHGYFAQIIPLVTNPELYDLWDFGIGQFNHDELPRFAAFLYQCFEE